MMSLSFIRSISRLSPAKKMWSPTVSVEAKPSSTLPSMRPFLKRTSIIGLSTMIPALRRCWAMTCGLVTRQWPGLSSTSRLELVIGAQRIAAGGDIFEDAAPHGVGEAGVRRGGADFGEQFGLDERAGAGDGEDVLGEDVERAGAEDLGVELARVDRVQRGLRLEIFEAVAGDDHALRGLVEAVVGAADALEQARRPLGRAHLADEVDIAPVDAEVEAGGGDERAQAAVAHRAFDLAPRFEREAAVVDADRQDLVVDRPQVLEDQFGEAAGVAEDERGLVLLDQLHHLFRGIAPRMPRPWHAALGDEDRQVGLGAGVALDQPHRVDVGVGGEPAAIGLGVADRRAEADAAQVGGERLEPGERQAEQVAALLAGEGVDLVDDDGLEAFEQQVAVGVAEQAG